MVDADSERQVALVRGAILARDGRDIGTCRARNESPPGLQVDFTFDEPVEPPAVALEVTRLYEQQLQQGWAALEPTKSALEATAEREGLGSWLVAVDAHSSLKKLRPHIEGIMRAGIDVRVDSLTSTDLLESDDPQAVVRRHREWANLGLISVERGDGIGVQVAGFAKGRGSTGSRIFSI